MNKLITKISAASLIIIFGLSVNVSPALAARVNYQPSINNGINYVKTQQQADGSITGFGGVIGQQLAWLLTILILIR